MDWYLAACNLAASQPSPPALLAAEASLWCILGLGLWSYRLTKCDGTLATSHALQCVVGGDIGQWQRSQVGD